MNVVIRSSVSGVWHGTLVETVGNRVVLQNARRAYSWEGALSCSELANTGPTGGRICVPVNVTVFEVCEIIEATPEASAAWNSR